MNKRNNKQTYYFIQQSPKRHIFADGGPDLSTQIGKGSDALSAVASGAFSNAEIADTSGIEEAIRNSNLTQFGQAANNNTLMSQYSAWNPLARVSASDIRGGSTGSRISSTLGAVGSAAGAGAMLGPPGAIIGGAIGLATAIGGLIAGGSKAKKQARRLNNKIDKANERAELSFSNAANNLDANSDLSILGNYSAFGGPLNKLANGGFTHGAMWDNGVLEINNGGKHQDNPLGGIQLGVDQEGIPNLVEEGEVKWNDYIFSNRMKTKEKAFDTIGLPTKYAANTYADAAKKLSKESEERPNDPISKNGLEVSLARLAQLQEVDRLKKEKRTAQPSNQFDLGGLMRYAPVAGSALGTIADFAGLTNKPDYTTAKMIGESTNNLQTVDFTPVGNLLAYNPLDKNFFINKMEAQAGATRRAISDSTSPGRNAALLAADFNTTNSIGNLARAAEEYNFNQRKEVEGFNRATNMFNSEGAMKAAQINKQNDELRLRGTIAQAELMEKQNMLSSQGRSANLSNLFNSMGDIGMESVNRKMLNENRGLYYTIGADGSISYKDAFHKLSATDQAELRRIAKKESIKE